MERNELLRAIPKVDELLRYPGLEDGGLPASALTELVRREIDALRDGILSGGITEVPDMAQLCHEISHKAKLESLPRLREVINATGVILHTNLGRACISEKAARAAALAAGRYSALEYDLATGARGSRHSHVEALLSSLTGAQSALVVNNNAAAVLLMLSAVAYGKEVIVSRGELVEIGGAFRVPDIMEACGCRLREVGTTNKTRLSDYENAISADTAALLKVHTSNYRVVGFSEEVSLSQLVTLGQRTGLPVIYDLGSGSLAELKALGISDEPTVRGSVKVGAELVSFSGDKLLGGPQAGIIVGKTEYVDKLKKHPLTRAMRPDKMTLAALEATLRSYQDPRRAVEEIPTLQMLFRSESELETLAGALHQLLRDENVPAQVISTQVQVGGGSVPCRLLPSRAVAICPEKISVNRLEEKLRGIAVPIVGRIHEGKYLLDVRTLWEDDFYYIAQAVGEAMA